MTDFDRTDKGDRSPSEGDAWTIHYDLSNHGHDAGSGVTRCVLKDVDRDDHEFTARCFKVLKLVDGQIRAAGNVTRDDFRDGKVSLPIIGGTGDYEDAEGDVTTAIDRRENHGRGGPHQRGGHGGEREFTLTVDLD